MDTNANQCQSKREERATTAERGKRTFWCNIDETAPLVPVPVGIACVEVALGGATELAEGRATPL